MNNKLPTTREIIDKLYEIAELKLLGEELPAEEEEKIYKLAVAKANNINAIKVGLSRKIEAVRGEKAALMKEIERLNRKILAYENVWERVKWLAIQLIEAAGGKIETDSATYRVLDVNGELEIVDEDKVPNDFVKVRVSIDRAGLRNHVIKHGGDVGYAKVKKKKSLRIT